LNIHKKNIPVALFLWQRPVNTRIILEKIVSYNPGKLLIIVDGPRNNKDKVNIQAVIDEVEAVRQNCSFPVLINAAEIHFGLKKRFKSGFDWIFQHVEEEVIVLEDDTIPSSSFFEFCSMALHQYKNDAQIAAICGSFRLKSEHPLNKTISGPFLNNIFFPWGWATWKSKFVPLYNPNLKRLSLWKKLTAIFRLRNYDLFKKRYAVLINIINGQLDTWDVQLQWNIILKNKKVLTPHINLIYNNGLDEVAATQKQTYKNSLFTSAKDFEFNHYNFPKNLKYLPHYDTAIYLTIDNFQSIKLFLIYLINRLLESLKNNTTIKKNYNHIFKISIFLIGRLSFYLRKPIINLVVVGEQKSGTSSIYNLLKTHPQIAAGKKKEKHIFDNPSLFQHSKRISLYKEIAMQFRIREYIRSYTFKYYLDCTPDYVFRKESIPRLAEYNPSCKLIYIMRNPVKRFISSYHFYFHTTKYNSPFFRFDEDGKKMRDYFERRPTTTFKEYFELESGPNPVFKALERGLYSSNIAHIYKYFKNDAVLLLFFENLTDPGLSTTEINKLFRFLDVEDIKAPFPHSHKSNKTGETIDMKIIDWLQNYYQSDQEQLRLLLNSDVKY